jgi:hypothetical protein
MIFYNDDLVNNVQELLSRNGPKEIALVGQHARFAVQSLQRELRDRYSFIPIGRYSEFPVRPEGLTVLVLDEERFADKLPQFKEEANKHNNVRFLRYSRNNSHKDIDTLAVEVDKPAISHEIAKLYANDPSDPLNTRSLLYYNSVNVLEDGIIYATSLFESNVVSSRSKSDFEKLFSFGLMRDVAKRTGNHWFPVASEYVANMISGKKAIIVSDKITDGEKELEDIATLRKRHAQITGYIGIIDTEQGGVERIRSQGIDPFTLTTLTDIKNYNGK